MYDLEPVTICRICHLTLDIRTDEDGGKYRHTQQDASMDRDHSPAPISVEPYAGQGRCDFCNASAPEWLVPSADFEVPGLQGIYSKGHWAACWTCALLADSSRWQQLLNRSVNSYQVRHGFADPLLRDALRRYHVELRKNILGESIRLPRKVE